MVAVAALAALLRLPDLGENSLWWDEVHSILTAQAVGRADVGEVLRAVSRGFSTYFVFLAAWLGSDVGEWWLRFPSALAGSLLPVVLAFMGRMVGGDGVGIRLGLGAAVAPYLVWHSREGRWYPITWLLIGIGALCFLELLRRRDWRWLLAWLGASLAACSTYAPAVALMGVQGACLILDGRTRIVLADMWRSSGRSGRMVWASVLSVGLFTCGIWLWRTWIAPVFESGTAGYGFTHVGGPRPGAVAYTAIAFSTGYTLGPGPAEWHALDLSGRIILEIAVIALGAVLLLGLAIRGVKVLVKTRKAPLAWALASAAVLPPAIIVLGCWWSDHAYAPRHVGVAWPFFLCLAAVGLEHSGRLRLPWVAAIVVLVLQGFSLWNLHADTRYQREDLKSAAHYIESRASPEDLILIFGGIEVPWEHYYGGEAEWRLISPTSSGNETESRLRSYLERRDVIWKVEGRLWEEPGCEPLIALVESWAPATERREFAGRLRVSRHESERVGATRREGDR